MNTPEIFVMAGRTLPRAFRSGFVRIKSAHLLSLDEFSFYASPDEVSLMFWGRPKGKWNSMSFASVRMFRLPKGQEEFDRVVEWFGRDRKKRARLPEGIWFEPSMLRVRNLPSGWEHGAFAVSGSDFIHTYQTKGLALFARFFCKAGTMLDHPLFKRIHACLRIVEDQWDMSLPDLVSGGSKHGILESEPDADLAAEIKEAAGRAVLSLGIKGKWSAGEIQKCVHEAIETARSGKRLSKQAALDLAIDLGSLWGQTLCEAMNWDWCTLLDGKACRHAVCSPTRSLAIDPLGRVRDILTSKQPNNLLLLFNMIVAGKIPNSPAKSYTWIGR